MYFLMPPCSLLGVLQEKDPTQNGARNVHFSIPPRTGPGGVTSSRSNQNGAGNVHLAAYGGGGKWKYLKNTNEKYDPSATDTEDCNEQTNTAQSQLHIESWIQLTWRIIG